MPGTIIGGSKAAITNKQKHGESFYATIGRKGGLAQTPTKGFGANTHCYCDVIASEHYKRQCAGRKGGTISKRRPNKPVGSQ